jgi:hypothetical protein
MTATHTSIVTIYKKSQSRFAFWSVCLFAFAAFFLLLVLLTGCEQTGANTSADLPQSTSEQGAGNVESGSSGFVIEDTATVDVEIDEE